MQCAPQRFDVVYKYVIFQAVIDTEQCEVITKTVCTSEVEQIDNEICLIEYEPQEKPIAFLKAFFFVRPLAHSPHYTPFKNEIF